MRRGGASLGTAHSPASSLPPLTWAVGKSVARRFRKSDSEGRPSAGTLVRPLWTPRPTEPRGGKGGRARVTRTRGRYVRALRATALTRDHEPRCDLCRLRCVRVRRRAPGRVEGGQSLRGLPAGACHSRRGVRRVGSLRWHPRGVPRHRLGVDWHGIDLPSSCCCGGHGRGCCWHWAGDRRRKRLRQSSGARFDAPCRSDILGTRMRVAMCMVVFGTAADGFHNETWRMRVPRSAMFVFTVSATSALFGLRVPETKKPVHSFGGREQPATTVSRRESPDEDIPEADASKCKDDRCKDDEKPPCLRPFLLCASLPVNVGLSIHRSLAAASGQSRRCTMSENDGCSQSSSTQYHVCTQYSIVDSIARLSRQRYSQRYVCTVPHMRL